MPLLCPKLTNDELKRINLWMLSRVPHNKVNPHPLFDDVMTDNVLIDISNTEVAVFISRRGFFFERRYESEIETTIHRMFESQEQVGIVTPFVIDNNDPSVVSKLLTRFVESYGSKLARQIDYYLYNYEDKKLMLVKFSPSVLRFTMAPSGGTLKTYFKGPTDSLKQIPTLTKFVGNSESSSSVFATQYGEGSLPIVQRIHYDIMREVISKPDLGICIGPIAQWDV